MENFGRFNLIHRLAIGGMAEVYLACPKDNPGQRVVIKRILPHLAADTHFIGMFLNEARIAVQLNHPNVVRLFDLGKEDNYFFISMEYIHGEDLGALKQAVSKCGRLLSVPIVLKIASDICLGLQYTHTLCDLNGQPLHLVHRDISPQNIMVTFQGSVKLLDFGVARAANQSSNTLTGEIKGKYSYLAPEQARGLDLDARADIFSLGIVLYELLTGTNPLKRDNELMTLRAAMDCDIPPPSHYAPLPPGVESLILKAIRKNRDERYANAEEFRRAILALPSKSAPATTETVAMGMQALFYDRFCRENPDGSDKFTDFDIPSQDTLKAELNFQSFPKLPSPKAPPELQALTEEWDMTDDNADILLISEDTQTNSVTEIPAIRSSMAPPPRMAPPQKLAPPPALPSLMPAPAAPSAMKSALDDPWNETADQSNSHRSPEMVEPPASGRTSKPMPAMGASFSTPPRPKLTPSKGLSDLDQDNWELIDEETTLSGTTTAPGGEETTTQTQKTFSDSRPSEPPESQTKTPRRRLRPRSFPRPDQEPHTDHEEGQLAQDKASHTPAPTLLETDLPNVLAKESIRPRSARKTLLVDAQELEDILQQNQSDRPVVAVHETKGNPSEASEEEDEVLDVSASQIFELDSPESKEAPHLVADDVHVNAHQEAEDDIQELSVQDFLPDRTKTQISIAQPLPGLSDDAALTVAELQKTPLSNPEPSKHRPQTKRPVSTRGQTEAYIPLDDELTGTTTAPGRATSGRKGILKRTSDNSSFNSSFSSPLNVQDDVQVSKKHRTSSKYRKIHSAQTSGAMVDEEVDEPTNTMPGAWSDRDEDHVSLSLASSKDEQDYLSDDEFLNVKSTGSKNHPPAPPSFSRRLSSKKSRTNQPVPFDPQTEHIPVSLGELLGTLKDYGQRLRLWLDKLYDHVDSVRKQNGLSWEVVLVSFIGFLILVLIIISIMIS